MHFEAKQLFEVNDKIIDVINSGGSVVKLLGLPSEKKCSMIENDIVFSDLLGSGVSGKVWSITFEGMGERLYVVKEVKTELEVLYDTQEDVVNQLEMEGFDWNDIREWQPEEFIDAWENAGVHDHVSVVVPPKPCVTKTEEVFEAIPQVWDVKQGYETIKIPPGSYICNDEAFSEFCISVYAGKLYRDFKCINFFNVYSMFSCLEKGDFGDNNDYRQYTFMDKIDGELKKYTSCVSAEKFLKHINHEYDIVNGVYLQTLFAIAAYQHEYQLLHNDLHLGNVFVEFVTEKTEYNGNKLIDADYYHYRILGKNLYFPAIPVIVKIGDFGLATKYSKPIIGSYTTFKDGYDQEDGQGPWFPNIYMPQYDSLFFSAAFLNSKCESPFVKDCTAYMTGLDNGDLNNLKNNNIVKTTNLRPVLKNLGGIKGAYDTLMWASKNKYGKKPTQGKIVRLGNI